MAMNYKSNIVHHESLVKSIKFWIITLILVLFYSSIIFAQYNNTLYFDPSNSGDPDQDGSIEHPFDLFSDVNITNNTECLIKRGTLMEMSTSTSINNRSFVRIGPYGEGEMPIVKMISSNTKVFHIRNGCDNIILDSLKIEGMGHESEIGSTLIYIDTEVGSQNIEDVTINNCELYNGTKGIESNAIGNLSIERLSIIDCEIHNIGLDGISLRTTNDIKIEGCHIYDVNMFWHTNGHTFSESNGSGILISQSSHNWKIHNNIIDRRYTGNKFCFILGGSDNYSGIGGEIIGNTFYPSKDTVDDQGGGALFISPHATQFVKIERNYFSGRADNRGNKFFEGIGTIAADTTMFNYNVIDSITKEGTIQGFPDYCEVAYVNNNTIASGSAFAMQILGVFPNAYAELKNNLTAANTDNTPIYVNDVPNIEESNNIQLQTINTSLYNTELSIVNWETSDFRRVEDLNDGLDVGILCDFDSVLVSNPPEVGSYEYIEGSILNTSPSIGVQGFYVLENEQIGEEVGLVEANDPDTLQSLIYSILSGNTDNTFQINPTTGILTVNNNETLNFETNPGYSLLVQVQDNGPGNLIAQAIITVGLIDVNEAPIVKDQSIGIEENSPNNQEVGYVYAVDPDNGQELTFSILTGNTNDAFAIDELSGMLIINNSSIINYESTPEFGLTVQIQDNGPGQLTSEAIITIILIDINEAPEMVDQSFEIYEFDNNNSILVGSVQADDPDFNQSLTYSILPGVNDMEEAFHINSVTGTITIFNDELINYEQNPIHNLTIEVQDNGEGLLTDQAIITIHILDVNEPPVISDQDFTINIDLENDINNNENTFVGSIEALDEDYGQIVSFSILSGNDRNIFSLVDNSGKLVISDPFALYEQDYYNYPLIIKVEDNSPQQLYATATVNIHVNMDMDSFEAKTSNLLLSQDLKENQFSMNVYPNPTNSSFDIDLQNLQSGETAISLFNAKGEIMMQESFIHENANFTRKFNVDNFSNGLYIIQISNNSTVHYSKIVKQ